MSVVAALSVVMVVTLGVARPASADAGFPGTSPACQIDTAALTAELATVFGGLGVAAGLVADQFINGMGVTWVDPSHPMQSETGMVEEKSDYATNDLFIDHDSHDQAFDVRPDPSSQFLMSDANIEDKHGLIENEWESNDFPTWAWPNVGDRVWVNGNWVLDCNHEEGTSHHFDAEIHPMRAIASMRQEVHTLPGSGTTPVAVTGTDLYIHGDGGYDNTVLECGVNVVLLVYKALGNCTPRPGIAENYEFEIPLGAAPFPGAVPASSVDVGPGNTLAPAPSLTFEATSALDGGPAYLVHVPLAGSGATNSDVYARKIYSGWVAPPHQLHHFVATLVKGHINNDMDPIIPFDGCDCIAFMSVNRATDDEWSSLAGYDDPTDISGNPLCPGDNTLDSWKDGGLCGSGDLNFHGPTFDFYLHDAESVTMHFFVLDSDCIDSKFGSPHSLEINGLAYGLCFLDPLFPFDGPQDDGLGNADATFDSNNLPGDHVIGESDHTNYAMTVHVDEVPLGAEDAADLAVSKSCTPSQVIAPAPFHCRVEVTNAGPGLPHDVKVTDTITAPTTNYTILHPTLSWENVASPPAPTSCTVSGNQVGCDLGTVPLAGAKAVISYDVTSNDGGTFTDTATVSSGSTDTNSANNSASASATVVVPTHTALASSADPSRINEAVTYTATVTAAVGTSTPTGNVTFYDGTATISGCSDVPLSGGQGQCTVTYTSTGNHHLTAAYGGTATFLPSTSPPLGQTVTRCAKLAGCNLRGADLTNAQLADADLEGANLRDATLTGANLAGANLNDANLNDANLNDADLTGADLTGANLNDATLIGANLHGANLAGANLHDANLTDANLTGALSKGANFTGVTWSNTTCPDATNSTADGGTCAGHL